MYTRCKKKESDKYNGDNAGKLAVVPSYALIIDTSTGRHF